VPSGLEDSGFMPSGRSRRDSWFKLVDWVDDPQIRSFAASGVALGRRMRSRPGKSALIGANPMNGESRSIRSWVRTCARQRAATVSAVTSLRRGLARSACGIRRAFFPSALPFPRFDSTRRYCRCAGLAVHRRVVDQLTFRRLAFRGLRSATNRDN
jgi:hypothetical protein